MAFTEDFDAFFDTTNGFAVSATWTPSVGDPSTVSGIFDNEYFDETGGMVDVEGSNPRFTCAAADVQGIAQGDGMTIEGADYNVVMPRPDGTGLMVVDLEESES